MFCLGFFLSTSAQSSVELESESPTFHQLGFLPCLILLHVCLQHCSVFFTPPPPSLFPLLTYFVVPTLTFRLSGVFMYISVSVVASSAGHPATTGRSLMWVAVPGADVFDATCRERRKKKKKL